jgi:hypothetical protein
MADSIIDGTHIDTNVISYSAPKAHESGAKVVNVYNRNSKESLTISTPLILTWGAQEGVDTAKKPTGKYTLALQFPSAEYPDADCTAFLESMRALEARVKADALTYSKEWFGKNITNPEIIDEKFNVMLRHPKIKGTLEPDLSKSPTLTVKIPCWNGVWKPEIYDEDGNPLYVNGKVNTHLTPLEFLKPKTHVLCLIQCGGIWFVNGKFSITWNLKQAIVQKPKASLEGQCFLRPKASDKEKMKALPAPDSDVVDDDAEHVVSTQVLDSDDDEPVVAPVVHRAPPVAPAPTPAPAPVVEEEEVKPKKKIIRKKDA